MGNNRAMLFPDKDVRGLPKNLHYTARWWLQGVTHRDDGPAVIYKDGTKAWYQYGKLHRIDGPAIEHPDGGTEWYQDNTFHRTDGPAVEYPNNITYWFIHGFLVTTYANFQFLTDCQDSTITFLKIKYGKIR